MDLILTTAPVDFEHNAELININALLSKNDISRLSTIIKKLYSEKIKYYLINKQNRLVST